MNRVAALVAAMVLLVGCGAPQPGPIFPPVPRFAWPPPPDESRIEYVGALEGERNLGVRPSGWEAFRLALSGDQPSHARFVTPLAVAIEGDLLYVADPGAAGGPCVHVLDLHLRKYRALRAAGGAPLEWPIDVFIAPGRVGVVDARRAAVFMYDHSGRELASLGSGQLLRPAAGAWCDATRELWVVDAAAHACVIFSDDGAVVRRVGARGSEPGEFNFPAGAVVRRPRRVTDTSAGVLAGEGTESSAVFIADAMNFRVTSVNVDGTSRGSFGRKGDAAGCFSLPRDVALDSEGHIYVLDNQFENVQVFDTRGRLLMAWGEEGRGPGQFYLPSGITIDDQDRIWVADTYNRRVQVFRYLPARENASRETGSGSARPAMKPSAGRAGGGESGACPA